MSADLELAQTEIFGMAGALMGGAMNMLGMGA